MVIYLIYFVLPTRAELTRRGKIDITMKPVWYENRWNITVLVSAWKITLNCRWRIEEIPLHDVDTKRFQFIENLLRVNRNRDYVNIQGIGDSA
jgi:hypothetical protein